MGSRHVRGTSGERKGNILQRLVKSRSRVTRITFIWVLLAVFGNMLMQGTARADYAPAPYTSASGAGDVLCVGSDTVQYVGDFMADGDSHAHAGFNAAKPTYKFVNIDATADANARLIVKAVNSHDNLVKALENVRKIIAEGALTGFNYKDGDWAERLFESQQVTSAALAMLKDRA